MLVSYNWIQEHIQEKLPSADELREKIIFHAFEVESFDKIKTGDVEDTIFDIDVLPNRAGDCLSHYGMAREIAGLYGFSLKEKKDFVLPQVSDFPVNIESDLCKKYITVKIDDVKVGASPKWLKGKLEAIGQRSVNNIVDATNFVLFDSGQPVHAFDSQKIDGGIIVRSAHDGETIKLLGGEEKMLKNEDLVISDYLGALAIAGVKGGASAEVTNETTSIVIEVANFDAIAVRKTSRRLNTITDASKRFENGVSIMTVPEAVKQIVSLVLDIAGGTVVAIHNDQKDGSEKRSVSFSLKEVTSVLGNSITNSQIEDVLSRYHYDFTKEGDAFTLTVPYFRSDITGPHDIAEEVGRVIGYDTIEAKSLPFVPVFEKNEIDMQISAVKSWCIENGYREVMTYAFRSKGEVYVSYGAKDKSALRSNLSDGLKESYESNKLSMPLLRIQEVKIFEVGTVFLKDREEIRVAICDKGTIQELSVADFIKEKNITVLENKLNQKIDSVVPFKPWSAFPFISRDISVWLNAGGGRADLELMIEDLRRKYPIKMVQSFPEYKKDGRTSIAFRIVFQADDRTLTDAEVSTWFNELVDRVKAEKAFEIR